MRAMNRCTLFGLSLLLAFSSLADGQEAPALSALTVQKFTEIQELQQRHRYVDALAKLDELEAESPDLVDIYNMRGSIYLTPALRDFAKATEMFDKAEKMQPGSLPPRFNKAELLFVKHDWAGARAAFQKLLEDFPKLPLQVRHLVLYKRLVCEVKQDQIDAANKTLKDHFTFMDDTPAYYMGHAAIAFQQKKESEAKDWIKRADGIFKTSENSPYMDTLMEARWVPNIGLPAVE